jgi:formylglycine-generating enzyme required for sulfatase activity
VKRHGAIGWGALVLACCAGALAPVGSAAAGERTPAYIAIPAGSFASTLSNPSANSAENNSPVHVDRFALRETPVTNGEFLSFVMAHPEWRRDRIPATFADTSYLHHWESPSAPGAGQGDRPVTSVSWFAAQAYCEAEQARLPTWYEWEYVAAASKTSPDARRDVGWRAEILRWYGRTSEAPPAAVGGIANFYGVKNMHGLVWEWVDDFNALLISADSRNQGDPDKLTFCGAGAISLQDRENYAVLMRVALLSSLQGADTTNNLGFRCARSLPDTK